MSKYPPSHYPNSGIQHTRAVVALTIAQTAINLFKPGPLIKLENSIQYYINLCSKEIKKKKMSAGGERDYHNCTYTFGPYIENLTGDKMKIARRWGAVIWCALTFIEDVINTCPQYANAEKFQKWDKLRAKMEELAEEIEEITGPDTIDIDGTAIYQEMAYALDGIPFKSPENLEIFSR